MGYVCDLIDCALGSGEVYPGVPGCTRGYVCDSNVDCEDGYDEKPELCAAGAFNTSGLL